MNKKMPSQDLIDELTLALTQVNSDPTGGQLLAERAMVRAQRNGWIGAMAFASLLSGYACKRLQLFDEAIENIQRAVTLFRDVQLEAYVAKAYYALGRVYVRIGEFSLALEQFRKALTWIAEHDQDDELKTQIHIKLCKALMNLGHWSDAEQEIININPDTKIDDPSLIIYQLLVLRLAFYRGDQKSVREQLNLCQQMIYSNGSKGLINALDYYTARYTARYDHFKKGNTLLKKMWSEMNNSDIDWLFLYYEAASEALQSDYPQTGVEWFNTLLELHESPNVLKHRIHISLAHFFIAHVSYENAIKHYQASEKLTKLMRDSEVNLQWVRYRAEQTQQSLKEQIIQHKKSNQILAESNALLQAVNRIAMSVNAALDSESLLTRLREQLSGWVDVETIGIAEVKGNELEYGMLSDGDRKFIPTVLSLENEESWLVKTVNSGRILYDNNYKRDETVVAIDDIAEHIKAVAFTPLRCDNRIIGVLALHSGQAESFDLKAISLLEYITPVIGIALANLINLKHTRELSGELSEQQQELDDVRQLMVHLTEHDEVTGLPNRTSLPQHFKTWKLAGSFNCFILKIDNFIEINQTLGFGFDNKLVKVIGQRLFNRLRPDDQLIRMSEDSFLLITNTMGSKRDMLEFAAKILSLAEQPMREVDETFNAKGQIGIAQYPDHGETVEELMSMASLALQHAALDESSIFCIE